MDVWLLTTHIFGLRYDSLWPGWIALHYWTITSEFMNVVNPGSSVDRVVVKAHSALRLYTRVDPMLSRVFVMRFWPCIPS